MNAGVIASVGSGISPPVILFFDLNQANVPQYINIGWLIAAAPLDLN
jgi:hypothetical protein